MRMEAIFYHVKVLTYPPVCFPIVSFRRGTGLPVGGIAVVALRFCGALFGRGLAVWQSAGAVPQ